MTPNEFIECAEVWRKNKEAEVHLQYEISRFNSWLNLAPYINNKSQEDVYKFPWEETKTAKVKTAKLKEWRKDQRNIKN